MKTETEFPEVRMRTPLALDGSQGEGGGQILRTALALSLIIGRPFELHSIRAKRVKPGLQRQHLACVEAAAKIGNAITAGAELGSTHLTFSPGTIQGGIHEFRIGSAGSTLLLMQTVLPALLHARVDAELVLEGGTHNPMAPPEPFVQRSFLPALRQMGFEVELTLERPGFYPQGGGLCRVAVRPSTARRAFVRDTPPPVAERHVTASLCIEGLPEETGRRPLAQLCALWNLTPAALRVERTDRALGSGFTVHLAIQEDGFSSVFTAFGERRIAALRLVEAVTHGAREFIASGAAVEEHLADQLLLLMALAAGGSFTTHVTRSQHLQTNADILQRFLGPVVSFESQSNQRLRVQVQPIQSA